jgi:hypothetical protein
MLIFRDEVSRVDVLVTGEKYHNEKIQEGMLRPAKVEDKYNTKKKKEHG